MHVAFNGTPQNLASDTMLNENSEFKSFPNLLGASITAKHSPASSGTLNYFLKLHTVCATTHSRMFTYLYNSP